MSALGAPPPPLRYAIWIPGIHRLRDALIVVRIEEGEPVVEVAEVDHSGGPSRMLVAKTKLMLIGRWRQSGRGHVALVEDLTPPGR